MISKAMQNCFGNPHLFALVLQVNLLHYTLLFCRWWRERDVSWVRVWRWGRYEWTVDGLPVGRYGDGPSLEENGSRILSEKRLTTLRPSHIVRIDVRLEERYLFLRELRFAGHYAVE